MLKRDELTNPNSCMSRAKDDEMTFVLLGRDAATPLAIRAWVAERIRLAKNTAGDPQIVEALAVAMLLEEKHGVQEAPPQHAYELKITIGANTWDYAVATVHELAHHIEQHGENCSLASGSWNGCHSVDIQKRDVSPDDYRNELQVWSKKAKPAAPVANRG